MKNYKFTFFWLFILISFIVLIFFEFNTKYIISKYIISKYIPLKTNKENYINNLNSTITNLNYNSTITNSIYDKGKLFIVSHNFEHKDIFIAFKYFQNFNQKFYMLFANKIWNHLLEPLRPKNIEFIYVTNNTVEKITSKILLGNSVIMFLYNESISTGPYYILQNTKCKTILLKIKEDITNERNKKSNYNDKYYEQTNKKNTCFNQIETPYAFETSVTSVTPVTSSSNHFNSNYFQIYLNNLLKTFTLTIKKINYKFVTINDTLSDNIKSDNIKRTKNLFMKQLKEKLYN